MGAVDRRRAELDGEMREVLMALNLFSHVQAVGYEPTRRGRSSDDPEGGTRPPGDVDHMVFAAQYGPPFHERSKDHPGAKTNQGRAAVLDRARDELKQLRGGAARPQPALESLGARNGRIVREGEGFTVREVAINFRCGESEVRRARKDAGREPDLGKRPERDPDAGRRRQRARELEATCSVAQIARLLGVSRSTIERDLGKRAA